MRHARNWTDQQRLYKTAAWRRLRTQVLLEQPFCAEAGCDRLADEVHHLVKRLEDVSLFFERTNVLGLCRSHHAARTRRGE